MDASDADGLTDGTYFSIKTQGANGTASIDAEVFSHGGYCTFLHE